MYSKIVNPETNRVVYVKSKLGKKIIKQYMVVLSGGSASSAVGLLPDDFPEDSFEDTEEGNVAAVERVMADQTVDNETKSDEVKGMHSDSGGAATKASDSDPIETSALSTFMTGSNEDIERLGGLGMIAAHGNIIPDEYIIIPEGINIITITHRGDVLAVDTRDEIGPAQIVVDSENRLMLLQEKLRDEDSAFYKSGNIIPDQTLNFRTVFPGRDNPETFWSYGGIWKWTNPSHKIPTIRGSGIGPNGYGRIADISRASGNTLKDYVLSKNDETIVTNDDLWTGSFRFSDILRQIITTGKQGTYILYSCRSKRGVVTPSDTCNRIMASLDNKIKELQSKETKGKIRKTLEKVFTKKHSAPLLRRFHSNEPEDIPESLSLITKYYKFVNYIEDIRKNIDQIDYVFTTPVVKYLLEKNGKKVLKKYFSLESEKTTIIGLHSTPILNGTVGQIVNMNPYKDTKGNWRLAVTVDGSTKKLKVDNLIISPKKKVQSQIIDILTRQCLHKYENIRSFSAKEICIYLDLFQNKINIDAWKLKEQVLSLQGGDEGDDMPTLPQLIAAFEAEERG